MQSAIYQLTLVFGMGILAVLLIRGYSLQEALVRSGLVLVAVLFLLIVAGNILRLSMQSREPEEESTTESIEPVGDNESKASTPAET